MKNLGAWLILLDLGGNKDDRAANSTPVCLYPELWDDGREKQRM